MLYCFHRTSLRLRSWKDDGQNNSQKKRMEKQLAQTFDFRDKKLLRRPPRRLCAVQTEAETKRPAGRKGRRCGRCIREVPPAGQTRRGCCGYRATEGLPSAMAATTMPGSFSSSKTVAWTYVRKGMFENRDVLYK